jgi:hypothetical protein
MKTYNKTTTTQENRIVIQYDTFADNPRRDNTNLGYFITVDRDYHSPDKHDELENLVKQSGIVAESQNEHIKLITKEFNENNAEQIIAVYPVTKYEHGNVVYTLGTKHGFDNSNNGFYIVTDSTANELGTKPAEFESVIKEELAQYTKYANGEVYRVDVYDEDGELQDCCSGFYDIEDIRSGLPADLQDEDLTKYVI